MATADLSAWGPLSTRILGMIQSHCPSLFARAWWPKLTQPGQELSQLGLTIHSSSKFGGRPWISEEKPCPECQNCEVQMTLICQLMLKDTPVGILDGLSSGMFQSFVCSGCFKSGTSRVISDSDLNQGGYFSLEQQSCRVSIYMDGTCNN